MAGRQLTDEHKQALARGRVAGRAIKRYLQMIETEKARRPSRSATDIDRDLAQVELDLPDAGPVQRVLLYQTRIDLRAERAAAGSDQVDVEVAEADFVEHVSAYSAAKGITYAAWREFGVPADVLRRGGMDR